MNSFSHICSVCFHILLIIIDVISFSGIGDLPSLMYFFEIMKSIRGEIIKTPGQFEGQIRIVSTHAVIQSYLPKYIVNFKKDNPKVVFNIHGGGLKKILEMVESSEADFGFLNLESVPDGLIYHDLFDTKLVLVAPKKINFPEKNSVTLEQIAEQPFIFFPHTSTITPLIEEKFAGYSSYH